MASQIDKGEFVVRAIRDLHTQTTGRSLGLSVRSLKMLFHLEYGLSADQTINSLIRAGTVLLVSRHMYGGNCFVFLTCRSAYAKKAPEDEARNEPRLYLTSALPKNWKDGRFTAHAARLRITSTAS